MANIRAWFEFQTLAPNNPFLWVPGQILSGGVGRGFWVPETDPLDNARAFISGPDQTYAKICAQCLTLDNAPRGINWSGHVLKRQAMAKAGTPIHPTDSPTNTEYITACMNDVLVGSPDVHLAYINHEYGGEPDWIADTLIRTCPHKSPLTMVSGLSASEWPVFTRWGQVACVSLSLMRSRPGLLASYVSGWLAFPGGHWARYANTTLGPLWNSIIDTFNAAVGAHQARITPVAALLGITTVDRKTDNGANGNVGSSPAERRAWRIQAELLSLAGVTDAVVFNQGGRGVNIRDPANDFGAMLGEDVETIKALSGLPTCHSFNLPTQPIPLDSPQIVVGKHKYTPDMIAA